MGSGGGRRDTRVGFCDFCRQDAHGLCASDGCRCAKVIHTRRPGFGRARPPGSPLRTPRPPKASAAPPRSQLAAVDPYSHALAVAQLEARAAAAGELDRVYASIERRLERIAASLVAVEALTPVPVSPGQLRLVVNG